MTSSVPHLRFPDEDKEAQRGEGTVPKSCRRQEDLQDPQGGERGGGGEIEELGSGWVKALPSTKKS